MKLHIKIAMMMISMLMNIVIITISIKCSNDQVNTLPKVLTSPLIKTFAIKQEEPTNKLVT